MNTGLRRILTVCLRLFISIVKGSRGVFFPIEINRKRRMMEYRKLGQTGIEVSRLCFGSLTIGPLQKNKTLEESRPIIEAALEAGINFFDTADLYNCYPYLKQALEIKKDLVICTKSYDYSAEGVAKSLDRALRELGRDYVCLLYTSPSPRD